MWNLTGDDVQRAKEELKGRRAAIQAQFDSEMSRVEAQLADIERVEHFVANFILNHKEDATSTLELDPRWAGRETAPPTNGAGEQTAAEKITDAAAAPAARKRSSRWRRTLSTGEASEE